MTRAPLRTCALFQRVPAPALRELARTASEVRVPRGAAFYEQGARSTMVHVLLCGLVKLVWSGAATDQVILGFVEPGDPFDLAAIVSNTPYRCSARAVDDSLALAWLRAELLPVMARYPQIGANALRLLAQRLFAVWDAYGGLATVRVEPRLAAVLARLVRAPNAAAAPAAAPSLRLGHRDLAACIGTTPYTVSRILSQWRREGLVDVYRERVVIRRPRRLEDIAGAATRMVSAGRHADGPA